MREKEGHQVPLKASIGQLSMKRFAYFIVDGLINEKLVDAEKLEEAVKVVMDELNVRKAIGDYSFQNATDD